jgi:hypothetical protein
MDISQSHFRSLGRSEHTKASKDQKPRLSAVSKTALQIWTRDEVRQFQRTSAALQFCHRDCAEVNQSKEVGVREPRRPVHLPSEDIRD